MKFTDFHNSELAEAAKTRNATRDFLRNNPVSPDQMAKPVKQMSVPEFDPRMAKMAYDEGVVKGVSLQDGVTLERATAINDWHTHDGGMYKKYFAKGFKAGRMNKINHDNKQYNLNLKLMKDGSVSHGEQGVAEGTGSNSRALKIAEKIWAKYGSPKNEDRIYPENLIDLVDAAAGGRTYFFRSEIEAVPGVKTIMASINGGKFYDRAKFDKGVAILLKAAPKSRFGESAEQGVAETNVSKYADLGATNDTTHFIKNITTGKIVSPHRGRQDAEDALVANMRDSDDEFKIVRARKKQSMAEAKPKDASNEPFDFDKWKQSGKQVIPHRDKTSGMLTGRYSVVKSKKTNQPGVAEEAISKAVDKLAKEELGESVSELNKHISDFTKGVKSSSAKQSTYKRDNKPIHNMKHVETDSNHQAIFKHLQKMGYKKTSGYDPKPNEFDMHHDREEMTSKSDPVHHSSGVSVHVEKEHGDKTKVHFTHHHISNGRMDEEGVAEGSEQVYKVVVVDKSNAMSKLKKFTVKAGSVEEVFERLTASDWYPLEINGVEVINGKRLKQGVAEGKGLAKKVKIVKGPNAGKTGWIREVKHGAFKGAPKTYYIDLDDGGQANNLPATALRLVKEQDMAEEVEQMFHVKTDQYGANKDVPLYTKTYSVRANSEQEAINTVIKIFGGTNHRIKQDVAEGRVASPVSRAITHRILDQRQDLLKFGPQAVMDAVDEVAEWVGEVEEIGSSDISAWVAQVARHLQTQDEQGVAEGEKWIQKAHVKKGGLHKALHVPQDETIPKSRIAQAIHSADPHLRHMAQFAKNVAKEDAGGMGTGSVATSMGAGNGFANGGPGTIKRRRK